MAYQINLTGQEIDERLQNIGTAEDVAAADGTLYARISKNADDIDELRDTVGHIDSAQTATGKTVTQHTADISTLQRALKTKANLSNGKVSVTELPIATSLGNPDNGTIPSTFAVNEAINNKIVGLLNWRGVKDTTDEIKAITSAKKGDVWHSNGDGSEWVCTQDITTANADAWTELGTPVNLSGYYTKTEVDKKVKPLADSIGTDSDVASANGSVYARIKKNAVDISTNTANINATKEKVSGLDTKVTANTDAIATKASNSDLAALQSKVELKANQSNINGALIQKLTTASTEAEIRKAFTEVNTKTVLFPIPGSIISKLDGGNKGIVVSLSDPDATTLGRTITVYHGNDTYAIIVKSDFTKVLTPWTEIHGSKKIYDGTLLLGLGDTTDVAKIKKAFTPKGYAQPVIPDTGDIVQNPDGDFIVFSLDVEDAFAIYVYSPQNANLIIAQQCRKDFTTSLILRGVIRMAGYYYDGNALLSTEITTPTDIELVYTPMDDTYGYRSLAGAEPPKIGDTIMMPVKTSEEGARGIVVDAVETDNTYITRWFYGGKLYEAEVTKDFTSIPKYGKVIYDTTSGTLRDLYISAGAKYNEATGFYELNGLTDITEEQMRVIWQEDLSGWYRKGRTNLTRNIAYKGNDGGYSNGQKMSTICNGNANLEVFNLDSDFYASYSFAAFYGCTKLREVSPQYKIIPYTESLGYNLFDNCPALQEVRFNMQYVTRGRVSFSESPLLSKESVLSIITTMGAVPKENPFVITLHPTAYARLKDDADIVAALEAKGGIITLVSA